jgi:hypothetical protein
MDKSIDFGSQYITNSFHPNKSILTQKFSNQLTQKSDLLEPLGMYQNKVENRFVLINQFRILNRNMNK